jgi:hypothetical protein
MKVSVVLDHSYSDKEFSLGLPVGPMCRSFLVWIEYLRAIIYMKLCKIYSKHKGGLECGHGRSSEEGKEPFIKVNWTKSANAHPIAMITNGVNNLTINLPDYMTGNQKENSS